MDNFDLKRFLVENKMTRNSRLLNEQPETEGIPADDPLAQIPAVPAETPSEPSGEIDKETAKELIFNTGGKFFTVNFLAQDKDERGKQKVDANGVKLLRPRTMNARLGVKKYLRGGELKFNPDDFNLINVFDMVKKGYRFINVDTIQSLKIGNRTYTVAQETTEPTTDEPQLNEAFNPFLDTEEGGYMREYIDMVAEEEELDLGYRSDFDMAFDSALAKLKED